MHDYHVRIVSDDLHHERIVVVHFSLGDTYPALELRRFAHLTQRNDDSV
ncbi:MAG: hypothetical protein KDD60_06210 [Bdellovibrionales bacterium]|nr:hypothetical protein [Bdellovibrionales bacterium]